MQTTIVFPCYNEENRINKDAFVKFIRANDNIKLLFVDDGSTDNTLSILNKIKSEAHACVYIYTLDKNSGKAEAVRFGLLKALGLGADIIGYADVDLATPLYELKRLIMILNNTKYKILLGSRVQLLGRKIKRKLIRHYFGRVFATAASFALKLSVYDTQCGAKFFKCQPELKSVLNEKFCSRWIFDVELINRLLKGGISSVDFWEEPLNEWEDIDGSKLSILATMKAMINLIKIWKSL